MGRVIKEEDQSDVVPASFDENAFTEGSERIPAEEVSTSEASDQAHEDSLFRRGVLRDEETRRAARPVPVETRTVGSDSSPTEEQSEEGEAGTSKEEGAEEKESSGGEAGSTRTDAEWRAHLEEARTEGYEAGYEAGYEEGYEEAEETLRAEYEEQREALIEDTTRLDELWEQYVEESETMLVDLALRLAEAIVDAPLTDSIRKASEEAIAEAVAELANVPPVTVTVHPVDYQRLQESGLADRLREKYDDLHLEADPERHEGDWSVSSPEGAIRRLRGEVVETLRSHLGLVPPTSSSDAE